MDWYYTKPYCRVGPYAIGLICGMLLFTYRRYKFEGEVYDPVAHNICTWFSQLRIIRYAGLLFGLFLINFCMFIQYTAYKDVDNGWNNWNENETTVFMTFDRILFVLGIALILLPVLFGQFSLIGSFLGFSVWTPLSRLSFALYLIHPAIINLYVKNV
jgi:peptidoglycan/LPS O-acetylase OafA/YrhL